MPAVVTARRAHPAKWTKAVLDHVALVISAERRRLGRPLDVLDPFAGVGRIHDLPRRIAAETVGVEIEPEWAANRAGTVVGDATKLPAEWLGRFDVVATSPCYGNRMADHHEARDSCHACNGTGVEITETGCGDAPWTCQWCGVECVCGELAAALRDHNRRCSTCRALLCPSCGGNGLSKRYTYRHALGRLPSDGSAAVLGWATAGGKYRALHRAAWTEAHRVLRPVGLVIVNVKNHVQAGEEQRVMEWHATALAEVGFEVADPIPIPARGVRHGQNHGARVDNEHLIVGRRKRNS